VIDYSEITFVITTFRSEKVIYNCLEELPEISQKIIIENSGSKDLKIDLEKKYKNLKCIIMNFNKGYGCANNIGIKESKTNYVFIINPDVYLRKKKLDKVISILRDQKFSIASVLEDGEKSNHPFNKSEIQEKNFVKGFAILLDKKNMFDQFFDENIFLYLEETDLCLRVKKKGGRIVLLNVTVEHLGGNSHGDFDDIEMQKSRNWHWMWSKFYYTKKHNGYLVALLKTLPNFFSSLLKFFLHFIIFNKKEKIKYKMRFLGLINSYLLRKSFFRPYIGDE
jgi:N-acetylglucosaminyl-diphospho-decaprenol L-rhamnosyltransferase